MPLQNSNLSQGAPTKHLRLQWQIVWWSAGLLAFLFRWYYITHAVVYHPIRADASQYFAYAWNLVHHGIFSNIDPDLGIPTSDSYRDPGFPILIGFWMAINDRFTFWYPAVVISQALIGAATVMLLMRVAKSWIRLPWLAVAGVGMSLWPHTVVMTSYLLTETLFAFLCAGGIWILMRGIEYQRCSLAIGSGLTFGAASLTNAILSPFGPLLALLLLGSRRVGKSFGIALLLASMLPPLAWGVRNATLESSDTSTSRAAANLVQGSWPEYHEAYQLILRGDPRGEEIMDALNVETATWMSSPAHGVKAFAQRLASDPWKYIAWYTSKPSVMWGWSIRVGQVDIYVYPTLHSPFEFVPVLRAFVSICSAVNPLLMVMAAYGCFLVLWRHRKAENGALLVVALTLYATVIYSILQAEPRYSIPFRGEEILLATFAAQTIWSRVAGLRLKSRPIAA